MSIALVSIFYIVGVILVLAENSSSVQTVQSSAQSSLVLSTQPNGIQSPLLPKQRLYQQLSSLTTSQLTSTAVEPGVLSTDVVSNMQTVQGTNEVVSIMQTVQGTSSTVLEMRTTNLITRVLSPASSTSESLRLASATAAPEVSKSLRSISTTVAIAPSFSEISSHVTSSQSSNAPKTTTFLRAIQETDELSLHSFSLSPTISSSPAAPFGSFSAGIPNTLSTIQHSASSMKDVSATLIASEINTRMTNNLTQCTSVFDMCPSNTTTTSTSQYGLGSAVSSNNITLSLKETVSSSYIMERQQQTTNSSTSIPSVTSSSVSSSFYGSLLVSNTACRYKFVSSTVVDAFNTSILFNTVLPSPTFGRLMLSDLNIMTSVLVSHTFVEAKSASSPETSSIDVAEASSILPVVNHSEQFQPGTSASVYSQIKKVRFPSTTVTESFRLEHTPSTDFRLSPSKDINTSMIDRIPQSSTSPLGMSRFDNTLMASYSQPLSSDWNVVDASFATDSFVSGSSTFTSSSVLSSLSQKTTHPSLSSDYQDSNYIHLSPSPPVKLSIRTSKLSGNELSTPTSIIAISDSIVFSSVKAPFLNISSRASETAVQSVSTINTLSERVSPLIRPSEYASTFPSIAVVSTAASLFFVSSSVTPVVQIMPNLKFIFEFEGDCNRLILNAKLQIEFWQALIAVLSIESSVHIHKENVQPVDLTCKPFQVKLILKNLNFNEYTKFMDGNLTITNIGVPILDDMSVIEYEVKSVQIIPLAKGDTKKHKEKKQMLETADVIIIVMAGILFGFLLCMCVVIGCRECYRRRRAASFNLLDVPHVNLDMDEFTLTKIPRPQMIYRENIPPAPAPSIANGNRYNRPKHLPVSEIDTHKTNGTHQVNADSIQVRIQPHPDGVVVGVTCTPPRSPTRDSSASDSSPRSEASDPSKQSLLKTNSPQHGMANPNFECDEEFQVIDSDKYVIKEDEVEAFL